MWKGFGLGLTLSAALKVYYTWMDAFCVSHSIGGICGGSTKKGNFPAEVLPGADAGGPPVSPGEGRMQGERDRPGAYLVDLQ